MSSTGRASLYLDERGNLGSAARSSTAMPAAPTVVEEGDDGQKGKAAEGEGVKVRKEQWQVVTVAVDVAKGELKTFVNGNLCSTEVGLEPRWYTGIVSCIICSTGTCSVQTTTDRRVLTHGWRVSGFCGWASA